MPLTYRAAETVLVIVGGLIVGYLARRRGLNPDNSPSITRLTLTSSSPSHGRRPLGPARRSEPGAGLHASSAGGAADRRWLARGRGIGRMLRLRDGDLGAFLGSAMFSNIGITYGAFLCYALLGERGAGLGYLYGVSYMPTFFTLGFFVVSRHSQGPRPRPSRPSARPSADPRAATQSSRWPWAYSSLRSTSLARTSSAPSSTSWSHGDLPLPLRDRPFPSSAQQ